MMDIQASGEALKRENPVLQNMKFLPFFERGLFALLNPDPDNQNQCGSGSTTLETSI
jgi:hypothetical protein